MTKVFVLLERAKTLIQVVFSLTIANVSFLKKVLTKYQHAKTPTLLHLMTYVKQNATSYAGQCGLALIYPSKATNMKIE